MVTKNTPRPPRERPRGLVQTPDTGPSTARSGSGSGSRSTKGPNPLKNHASPHSLSVHEDKGTKPLSSPSRSHKITNAMQGTGAKEPIIYRPPSSLAAPRSRSQSPTASRVRTPNIQQQRAAATTDRRARQTTLFLNITTAPPLPRSPLGTINANNLSQIKNTYREVDESRQEPTWLGELEHLDYPSGSNSLPRLEFEIADENRRNSLSPKQIDPLDFSSSPPPKLDLQNDEDLSDEGLSDDGSWNESSFLRHAKHILEEVKDDSDGVPVFWTPKGEDTHLDPAIHNDPDLPLDADISLGAKPINAELGKDKLTHQAGREKLIPTASLESHSLEQERPRVSPEPPTKVELPCQLYTATDPETIPFLTEHDALKLYGTINFDSAPQWHHITQLHEVYKRRFVEFDWVAPEDWDAWFAPAISDKSIILKQQWKNCNTTDSQILRDIYCAFYVALRNVLAVVNDIVLAGNNSTVSGWMEVCVSPVTLLEEMRAVLWWDEETINVLRLEYGLDLLHFIDTQYELKSRSDLQRPTIDLTHDQSGHGYFLTCKRTTPGRYKLQISPPHIRTQWSIKQGDSGVECIVKPTVWHPHFLFSTTAVTPRFSVGQDFHWLEWDKKHFYFSGILPDDYKPHKDPSGHLCIGLDITVEFTQYFMGKRPEGSHLFYLQETFAARSYGILPIKPAAPLAAAPTVYSPNPLQLIWGSHKLGFDRRHSKFVMEKAQEYEDQIYQSQVSEDAKAFATHGLFPWDPKEPSIQSWGGVTWCSFLEQQRARAEYLRNDPRGRVEVIRDIRKGPRLGPLGSKYKHYGEDVDEDLEEMRRMYENLIHEAHAIVWLHTLYREHIQDRLEDESLEMEKVGLRNREALGLDPNL
ncbi:hypothetical protein TWF102_008601 [Orbilia oligospora]|uniref:Uncharacterized protein n=1 Tax=Orbilia oligospora TaxID=2813651 RepID=A0A7C8J6A4_ORBOL|nr:hypothetical protein TWF102_008601 [Orbilia oligospora]KAF3113693.1 hypothetical protein TWF103_002044 [Orbilia oligospora]